jgi:putative serine protease PepD
MRMHPKLKATALFAAAALGGGAVAAAIGATTGAAPRSTAVVSQTPAAALASATSSSLTAGEIYRRTVPGVVQIRVTTQGGAADGFAPPVSGGAQGTGFVIDTHGDIVTNEHVVAGALSIRVTLSTGVTYTARLVGANASEDVAVVRIAAPASALHPLRFADSRSVQVGAGVVAIGDPYGLITRPPPAS